MLKNVIQTQFTDTSNVIFRCVICPGSTVEQFHMILPRSNFGSSFFVPKFFKFTATHTYYLMLYNSTILFYSPSLPTKCSFLFICKCWIPVPMGFTSKIYFVQSSWSDLVQNLLLKLYFLLYEINFT